MHKQIFHEGVGLRRLHTSMTCIQRTTFFNTIIIVEVKVHVSTPLVESRTTPVAKTNQKLVLVVFLKYGHYKFLALTSFEFCNRNVTFEFIT